MDLLSELHYAAVRPSRPQLRLQSVASRVWAGRILSKTLAPIDKAVYRTTRGRHTTASLLAGIPVIMLTTTGARTGAPRTMPLLGVPIDGTIAVIGSNFGGASTPGWVYNLEADPSAIVEYRDRAVPVTARRATFDETERVFHLASTVYGAYPAYRARAEHREIRVFLLQTARSPR